jgi:uncharacterized membrane protein
MRALRALVGPIFVVAGALHFKRTRWYVAIMPDYLPAHRALVYASGVAEMAGGAGLMVPATRRPAGWWLIATLIAIFPANVWMAQHPERYRVPGGRATLIARLPLQAVCIALVRAAMRPSSQP